jgi:hypothetical protein
MIRLFISSAGFFYGQKNASDKNRRPVLTSETTKRKKVIIFLCS